MIHRVLMRPTGRLTAWLAVSVCVSAGALAWVGYRAISEWRRSTELLAEQRSSAAADLLVSAITRDMRAVHTLILSAEIGRDVTERPRSLAIHRIASGFARYPYPETFFAWRGDDNPGNVVFYGRRERTPAWLRVDSEDDSRFPVAVGRQSDVGQRLIARVARDAALARTLSVFDLDLAGSVHQVIAVLTYPDPLRARAPSVVGFTVDMDWVRRAYFQDLTTQVRRMDGAAGIALSVLDSQGQVIAGEDEDARATPLHSATRRFPMVFFDPLVLAVDPPGDLQRATWNAQASLVHDATIEVLNKGAQRTLAVAGVTVVMLGVGLVLTAQAARANARLVEMRSNLVSTVTHELKTPLAGIRAVTETLASGRARSPEMSLKYAQLALQETKRLGRLIDNLLAYSRISDVTEAYSFESLPVNELVEASLQEFVPQLERDQFLVRVDIPPDLPPVRADRVAIGLTLDNIIDNAIRYSKTRRELRVTAHPDRSMVRIEIADSGAGIPEDELPHVTKKFVRGKQAARGGSGLGLAIAHRILSDHHGGLELVSAVGAGTTVTVSLPVASA